MRGGKGLKTGCQGGYQRFGKPLADKGWRLQNGWDTAGGGQKRWERNKLGLRRGGGLGGGGRDALEGKGPRGGWRRLPKRLGAVTVGYKCH